MASMVCALGLTTRQQPLMQRTSPPCDCMRLDSSGTLGLWSTERRSASSSRSRIIRPAPGPSSSTGLDSALLPSTALESPTLATVREVPRSRAHTTVVPSPSRSARASCRKSASIEANVAHSASSTSASDAVRPSSRLAANRTGSARSAKSAQRDPPCPSRTSANRTPSRRPAASVPMSITTAWRSSMYGRAPRAAAAPTKRSGSRSAPATPAEDGSPAFATSGPSGVGAGGVGDAAAVRCLCARPPSASNRLSVAAPMPPAA
mmetsp:Transcript_70500/g.212039  ORF Transcript_70500/g.212039 Transcript_70500/m.212039 type:complete len:263 (+) Transcript_70500:781-1569(+)